MGYSLKKGAAKIQGLKFLKAEHLSDKSGNVEFDVIEVRPPAKGLNLAMVWMIENVRHGKEKLLNVEAFPVSRTSWLMLEQSWPHDDTDTFLGAKVKCRIVTTQSPGEAPYSRLHISEMTSKGDKNPVKIKELPRRAPKASKGKGKPGGNLADDERPPIDAYDDVPF